MKKLNLQILSLPILLMLIISVMMNVISAEGTPTIEVGSATAKPGESVDIPVSIENNPGICTYAFTFTFDSTVMTLEDVIPSEEFGGSFNFSSRAVWFNTRDVSENGLLLTLRFKVRENSPLCDNEIKVVYNSDDICNYEEQNVFLYVKPGILTITDDNVKFPETVVFADEGEDSKDNKGSEKPNGTAETEKDNEKGKDNKGTEKPNGTAETEKKKDLDSLSEFSLAALEKNDNSTVKKIIDDYLISNDLMISDLPDLSEDEQKEIVKDISSKLGISEKSDEATVDDISELYEYAKNPNNDSKNNSNLPLIISVIVLTLCIVVLVIVVNKKRNTNKLKSEDN